MSLQNLQSSGGLPVLQAVLSGMAQQKQGGGAGSYGAGAKAQPQTSSVASPQGAPVYQALGASPAQASMQAQAQGQMNPAGNTPTAYAPPRQSGISGKGHTPSQNAQVTQALAPYLQSLTGGSQ